MASDVTTPALARLALADGLVFVGRAFGAMPAGASEIPGEVVFNTAMSGYQEVVTDPSYRGQLVVMTAPQMGNVGWNGDDMEAATPGASGLVVRELSSVDSNWRSQGSLHQAMAAAGVPGISGVDTRALTRHLREQGAVAAVLSFAAAAERSDAELVDQAKAWGGMEGRDLVREVTCAAPQTFTEGTLVLPDSPLGTAGPTQRGAAGHATGFATGFDRSRARHLGAGRHVVVFDYGAKRNILRSLCDLGFHVTLVPATTTAAEVLALQPHGVMLSNGPGDPAALPYAVATVRALLDSGTPLFGICLGHQILGLALGGRTYKMKFGHHGINHPVLDLRSGQVEITSQNHGFAVDMESLGGRARLSHVNLNDRTVEGLVVPGRPVFSVQYHPEAAPGPHDAGYLFTRFARLCQGQAEELWLMHQAAGAL